MTPAIALAAAVLMQGPSEADLRNSPHWVRLPSAAEVAAAYPPAAKAKRVAGDVSLACTLDADGWLRACKVASETPAGQGFGQAALTLASAFRMSPLTAGGDSVEGRPVEAPIHFSTRKRR
jgi:protein TonB